MKLKGDIKDVTLILTALAKFYKTVEAYEAATAKFTPEQKERHVKLMVACYKQIYLGGCVMSQCKRIMDYMEKKGSITSKEAMDELGVFRLASRINDIKRMGVGIQREMVKSVNRYGDDIRFARYSIKKEQER